MALAASLVPLAHTGEHLGAITIPGNQLIRSMDSWKIYTAEQTALVMAAPGPSHVYVTRHHSWKTQYGGLTHKQVWESAASLGHSFLVHQRRCKILISYLFYTSVCACMCVCET